MKNNLLVLFLLLMGNFKASSQILSSQTMLKGKHQISLLHETIANSSTLFFKTNLPTNSEVEISFEVTQTNGVKNKVTIKKYPFGQRILLFKSMASIQQFNMLDLTLSYVLFGETYCLHWDQENNVMSFSKQGKAYNYANPFTLCATEFQWINGATPMNELVDESKIIELSKN